MDDGRLRESICAVGRKLYERRLVAAWDGNISARLPNGEILCTPTMVCKGGLTPDLLCVVDRQGRQVGGTQARTSEILLHTVIYRERADVMAIVHAHPPHATAFAVTGTPIPNGVLAEVEVFLGVVPTVDYLLPGTAAFAESVVPHLNRTDTLVLANHGAVAFGPTLDWAYGRMEILDAYCQILIQARALGPTQSLSAAAVEELLDLKTILGLHDARR